ncbi:MAG: RHS repeat protein, partial [Spirochaetaceae bacterium]|nr:RHS repeat protein [Spirochaetaceae bacterium]
MSAADMESERTYTNGHTNYYPSGTHLAPEKPTEDTLRLTPEGEFLLTRKDGSCWTYGVCGQLLRIEDRNGNRAAFHYNAEEQLHQITDSRGREVRLDRGPTGLLTEIHAPEETRICYAYDAAGRLAAVTDPAGDTVRYEYDRTRITRITKPDGSFREYGYEYVRGALRATTTIDEEGRAETFDFTSPDRTVHANPSGVETVHHFNADRRVSRIDHEGDAEHPGGLYELFAYNSTGDRTYRRATDGTEYRYAYDDRHNLLRVDHPDGTAEAWTYNSFDLPETHIDRRDHLTDYHYDGRGNLTRVDYPDRTADIFTYEPPGMPAAGEVTTHTDRRGNVRTYTYDPLGFLRSISDTIGPVARYEHDALGKVAMHEDGLGNRSTYTYTLDGRLDTVVGPEGLLIDHDYDERKDLVRLVANGRMTTFQYDDRHLLTLATNALGQTVSYDYRDDGRLRRRTLRSADGTGQSTTEFQYNDRGLLRREIQTDIGAATEYEYDAAGRVSAVIDAEGSRTEYRYSFDGRLVGRTRYLDDRSIEEIFQHYPGGPMRQTVDPLDRTTNWEHDPTLRTLTRVDPFWNRSPSTLDPYGLVLSETDPTGRSKFYDYD